MAMKRRTDRTARLGERGPGERNPPRPGAGSADPTYVADECVGTENQATAFSMLSLAPPTLTVTVVLGMLLPLAQGCYALPTGGNIEVNLLESPSSEPVRVAKGSIIPYYQHSRYYGLVSSERYDIFSHGVNIEGPKQIINFPARTGGGVFLGSISNYGHIYRCSLFILADGYWPKVVRQFSGEESSPRPWSGRSVVFFKDEGRVADRLRTRVSPQDVGLSVSISEDCVGVAQCHLFAKSDPIPRADMTSLTKSWPGIRQAIMRLEPSDRARARQEILKFCEAASSATSEDLIRTGLEVVVDELRGAMSSPQK